MACDLWGESPLYEEEGLKEGSLPTVTPIDKVPDEGNCGEVTNRGEEACECVVKNRTMKNREERSTNLDRGATQQSFDFGNEDDTTLPAEFLRPEVTDPALADTPSLNVSSETGLMEQVVDPRNPEGAWRRVKRNRGAETAPNHQLRECGLVPDDLEATGIVASPRPN